jgi:hypothetical protein
LLSYPPDRESIVNPIAWSEAANLFLDFASDCPEYFRGRPEYVRALREVYRRGEEFNHAMNRIATAPNGGVIRRLIQLQTDAIGRLEDLIRGDAKGLATRLGGLNPWAGAKQPLPEGKYVSWMGPATTWREHLRSQGYDMSGGANSAQELPFTEAECRRLVTDRLVPRAFCIAGRIRPGERLAASLRRSPHRDLRSEEIGMASINRPSQMECSQSVGFELRPMIRLRREGCNYFFLHLCCRRHWLSVFIREDLALVFLVFFGVRRALALAWMAISAL